jgi:ribosomal protein RSM22 (predicted rRNA methylase)
MLYLASRFAPDFAVLTQIFSEVINKIRNKSFEFYLKYTKWKHLKIKRKDPNFDPKHVFDFGSGVGTTMWAAHHTWDLRTSEIMNIDVSTYMNRIAELITRCNLLLRNL